MLHVRTLAAGGLLVGLAACSQFGLGDGTEVAGGEPPAVDDGTCGAAEFQSLVGTSVGDLDPATLPEPRRIIFPGQAVTMDYLENRFNVEIGADDKVARVYCG